MKNTNKKTGYIVLTIGIALLLFTFYLVLQAFLGPEFIQSFEGLVEMNRDGVAALVDVLIYLIPILLLIILGSIGGKITHYGIKLVRSLEPEELAKARLEEDAPKQSTSTDSTTKNPKQTKSTKSKTKARKQSKSTDSKTKNPKQTKSTNSKTKESQTESPPTPPPPKEK